MARALQYGRDDAHLATIEVGCVCRAHSSTQAIYFALRENEEAAGRLDAAEKSSPFDDLLWWFHFFRSKVPEEKRTH